jgi:hypothetical protein
MRDSANAELKSQPKRGWKLVTHNRPDTDALACLWIAINFVMPTDAEYSIHFVNAGNGLTAEEAGDDHVLHMDTGGGPYDQHGKELGRVSSALLLARANGLEHHPGLKPILDLTVASDNIDEMSPTSIHYYFTGLFHKLRNMPMAERLDLIRERAFEAFDVYFDQAAAHAKADDTFKKNGQINTLNNGIKICQLPQNAGNQREAAFRAGADVVLFSSRKNDGRVFFGIQVHRRSRVDLTGVMGAIRHAEADKRGLQLLESEEIRIGEARPMPGWFLHQSRRLIVCGSHSADIPPELCSRLKERQIFNLVWDALEKLPKYEPEQ